MHYVYRTIDVAAHEATAEDLGRLLTSARRLGFNGLNITHPLKQLALPIMDALSPSAARVGAVNTVLFEADRMIGFNTDVTGFSSAFDAEFPGTEQGTVVLVGAGGGGAAVATALASGRVKDLVILDADQRRAESLAAALPAGSARAGGLNALPDLLSHAAGVVNATPCGMAAHPGPAFDPALLRTRTWVADIVYRPAETELLAAARRKGCRVLPGLGMAMGQAADAFEIFTGEPADRAAMLADLFELAAAEMPPVQETGSNQTCSSGERTATMPGNSTHERKTQ